MAHNIHYICVQADDWEEAKNKVERITEDWGGENNWSSVIGVVEKNGKKHKIEGADTWEKISLRQVQTDLKETISFTPMTHLEGESKKTKLLVDYRNAEHAYKTYLGHKLDIWEDEIYPWEFDEVGLTNICNDPYDKKFIVVVNMHS